MWIDAICIDQASLAEKNLQVPLMRDIYSLASSVVIWLGQGSDSTDQATRALHRLVALCQDDDWIFNGDDLHKLLPEAPTDDYEARLDTIRAGLNDVFTRSWFDRTWTIQELALSQTIPTLHCGSSSICWECFINATRQLGCFFNQCNQADRSSDYWLLSGVVSAVVLSQKLIALFETRIWVTSATELKRNGQELRSYFSELLSGSQHSLCTDPRDKVYGILGMAEADASASISINYSEPVKMVYMRTTYYIIRRNGFSILAGQGPWPTREGWASWVVDFEKPAFPHHQPLIKPHGDYKAVYCTMSCTETDTVAKFLPGKVLRVFGVSIDEIVDSTPFWTSGETKPSGYHEILLSREIFCMFSRAAKSPLDLVYNPEDGTIKSSLSDAVARTLVADWIDPSRRYDSRPPGPTSAAWILTIKAFVLAFSEEDSAAEVVGISHDPDIIISTKDMNAFGPIMAHRLINVLGARSAIRTKKRWIGAAPDSTKPEDLVVAILGAYTPFILRPTGAGYKLVGECYVDGIMFGEIASNPKFHEENDLEKPIHLQAFDII